MRSIEHPGPVHPTRTDWADAQLRAFDITLQPGETLLQGLADALRPQGVASAVLTFQDASFAPFRFVMPALTNSPEHVAYFSERFEAIGAAHIEAGSITFGTRDGEPALHCHATWTESDGQRRSGHVLAAETQVDRPTRLRAWLIDGAAFEVAPDAETNFSLFQVAVRPGQSGTGSWVGTGTGSGSGLVVRLRPNQDLCTALETLCAERRIVRARIRGGVGSLIGARFADGRQVEPFVTEVFIREGSVEPGKDGALRAEIDVGLVACTGEIAEGRLMRGENPVLITFELVLEVLEVPPIGPIT